MKRFSSLAVIAGGGAFPERVARNAAAEGSKVFVVHLHGDSNGFSGFEDIVARPEKLGAIFAALRARRIRDLVLIGRMRRPHLMDLRPDWTTLKIMGQVAWALCFGGDDALLRAVRRMLEREGFTLHAAHEVMPALVATAGVMGAHSPDDRAMADIRLGMEEARAHGRRDAGQAVVVQNGRILAREDARGTDALMARNPAKGAILVKMAKPQQDRALDLPSTGIDTVRAAVAAGYAGIAFEAGATLVDAREDMIALADASGLFLIGVS